MRTVIVTDVHLRMTLAVLRELVRSCRVIAADTSGKKNPVGFSSRGIAQKEKLVFTDERELASELTALCRSEAEKSGERPVLLTPGRNSIAAASHHAEELSSCCDLLAPTPQALALCDDKGAVTALAECCGIPVPRQYNRESSRISYPCVLKYRCGEAHGIKADRRYAVLQNAGELERTFAAFSAVDPSPLLQEYIPGDGYGASFLMIRGSDGKPVPADFICHHRIRQCPMAGGPSSCCESFFDEELVRMSARLLREADFTGVAMVEWKGGPGRYRLMEINPRVWGTFPLVRVAESRFVQNWLAASCGKASACSLEQPPYRVGCKMQFFPTEAKLMLERMRARQPVGDIAADLFSPKVADGVFDFSDASGSLAYFLSLFGKK